MYLVEEATRDIGIWNLEKPCGSRDSKFATLSQFISLYNIYTIKCTALYDNMIQLVGTRNNVAVMIVFHRLNAISI